MKTTMFSAIFYDNYFEAEKYKDIGENCMGYYCELYERVDLDPDCPGLGKQYVLIE